ncbi:Uu.00g031010.m01.CDS01 [Anthostomella pinea]|uniref:Uu.00g031010.m01.CDS01 n=1 Tax=Anthostomella pinea TaxID=933095 RepID=A0AAI8V8G2_9PEZI|nr:Uu.00g031010.m01.CDS01 [Anthostomella pinea]
MAGPTPSEADNPFRDNQAIDDENDIAEPAAAAGFKKYLMYYTASRLDVTLHLHTKSSPAMYYVQSKLTSLMLLLRRGADTRTAPVVAFAKMRAMSRHMLLGRGDYEALQARSATDQIAWEELRREKSLLRRSDYVFNTAAAATAFRWRKDRNGALKTVYECVVDDGAEGGNDGRVVARLFSGGALNFKKGGEIDVAEGLDTVLEEMLLMSALAIWAMEALDYQSLRKGYDSSGKKI